MQEKRHPAGLRVLQCIIESKDWSLLDSNGIKDSDFFGDSEKCVKFLRNYYNEYSEFPDIEIVQEEITISFPSKVPLEYAVKNFKKQALAKNLSDISYQAQKYLTNGDPESAYSHYVSELSKIKPHTQVKSFKENAEERVAAYQRKILTGMKGIVPPWPTLKEAIVVWEDGTFNVILGVFSTGKSWCSAVAALHAAFEQDKRVLFVTMENSKESMESRLDALYHKIPFGDLRQGWVDLRTEKKWKQNIQSLKEESGDIVVADGSEVRTVGDVLQLVSVHNPNFVVIDGAYKLKSQGKEMFERSSNLLQDLHHSAEMTKIPWLASSQLNPSADKVKGKDTASEARGNKDWAINPATIMTLTQTPDQRLLNVVECRIPKVREIGDTTGMEMTFLMKQDRKKMCFEEVTEEFVNTEILDSIL